MRRTPKTLITRAAAAVSRLYGGCPTAVGVGPGRVEILGNHTDYNGGCVLTAAVDRYVVAAGRPTAGPVVRVHALDIMASVEFPCDRFVPEARVDWTSYVKSVFAVLRQAGVNVGGMEVVVTGDVPRGAGLGSSAALEAALVMLVRQIHPYPIDLLELAKLLQRGENEFTGVRCGLLDQFSALHGEEDRVIFLDCRIGMHETLTLGRRPPAIVLCNSGVTRELSGDAPYNLRRAECEQAAALLGRLLGHPVSALCTVSSGELAGVAAELPEPWRSRARHVIEEHERVLAARDSLRAGELERLGGLMSQSHESSRHLFENSCAALDLLCTAAARQPGCLGTRLCGGGWGGWTLSLVASGAREAFVDGMRRWSERVLGSPVDLCVCYASPGARGWRV